MAATATPGVHLATSKLSFSSSRKIFKPSTAMFGSEMKEAPWARIASSSCISSTQSLFQCSTPSTKPGKVVTKAMSGASENKPLPGLPIDLRGKRAFIAGVADDNGYGWAIAKSLAAAGAEILLGTWVPALNIFESNLRRGKFDESRLLPDGSLMEITKVYPLDAVFDSPEDVPEDIKTNKRYSASSNWTVQKEFSEYLSNIPPDSQTVDVKNQIFDVVMGDQRRKRVRLIGGLTQNEILGPRPTCQEATTTKERVQVLEEKVARFG